MSPYRFPRPFSATITVFHDIARLRAARDKNALAV
jgi:hypothetical protein